MKLLIIFGPPAVGKLTVGKLLEERTGFKLFHNHAVMDGIMHIFGRNTPAEDRLSRLVRENVIQEAAGAGIDLIFTYVWNFSRDKGRQNIDAYKQLYESRGGKVYFVELTASSEVRAERATDPERHRRKPSAPTAREISEEGETPRFTSPSPFFYPDTYLHIDTAHKTPEQIAAEIVTWQQTA
jgi:cytidylate kinase